MKYRLFITKPLRDNLLYSQEQIKASNSKFEGIIFLENLNTICEKDSVYLVLTSFDKLKGLKKKTFGKNWILFISDSDHQTEDFLKSAAMAAVVKNCSCFAFDMPFYDLLIHLNNIINLQNLFEEKIKTYSNQYNEIERILYSLRDFMHGEFFLLNLEDKTIHSSTAPDKIPTLPKIADYEALQLQSNDLSDEEFISIDSSKFFFVKKHCIILLSNTPKKENFELLPILLGKDKIAALDYTQNQLTPFGLYSKLFQDAIENRIDTEVFYEELKQMEKVNENSKSFFFWISISYNVKSNDLNPYDFFLKLRAAFGNQCIGKVGNSFHMLLRTEDTSRRFSEQHFLKLNEFCQKYNVFAVVSGGGYKYERVKTTLLMNYPVLRLGIHFRDSAEDRIFFFQEYSLYFLIDFFAKNYQRYYPETGIKYLVPGSVYSLYIHDKKNSTNLIEVLYTWLINNQNIKLTSEKLYMHRNTVDKKLKLIEKISGHVLSDFHFQYNAIFSYLIINYYEKMQKKNFVARVLPEA